MYKLRDNDIKEITKKEKYHLKKIELYEEMKMDPEDDGPSDCTSEQVSISTLII